MDQQEQPRSWPTKRQLQWAVGIVVVLAIAVLIGYRYDITLWDWIKLLIVPAVIGGGGLWFNRQQRERELEVGRAQRERDLEIADRRAQDEALQAYLDQIGNLLLDKDRPLRQSELGDEVQTLARARTLTVLRRLDGEPKGRVLQFLYEAGLIDTDRSIVALEGVNLRTADVSGTVLSGADLRAADLRAADLSGADLSGAYLSGAYLSGARGVTGDQLEHRGRVNLSRANLSGARGVTGDQLEQRALLEGTLMPNGQMYEDWIKDRDNRREAE